MNLTPGRHSFQCGFYVAERKHCKSTGCLVISVNNSIDLLVTDFLPSFFSFFLLLSGTVVFLQLKIDTFLQTAYRTQIVIML